MKAVAGVLITAILGLSLNKEKDIAALLALAACVMVTAAAMQYLEPVVSFINRLQGLGQLDSDVLRILFKAVGIGILAEISGLICSDAGNASLGKTLQILACAVILWISIPIFESLIDLIQQILGGI